MTRLLPQCPRTTARIAAEIRTSQRGQPAAGPGERSRHQATDGCVYANSVVERVRGSADLAHLARWVSRCTGSRPQHAKPPHRYARHRLVRIAPDPGVRLRWRTSGQRRDGIARLPALASSHHKNDGQGSEANSAHDHARDYVAPSEREGDHGLRKTEQCNQDGQRRKPDHDDRGASSARCFQVGGHDLTVAPK